MTKDCTCIGGNCEGTVDGCPSCDDGDYAMQEIRAKVSLLNDLDAALREVQKLRAQAEAERAEVERLRVDLAAMTRVAIRNKDDDEAHQELWRIAMDATDAELSRMARVVEAAVAWCDSDDDKQQRRNLDLTDAVDAYRAGTAAPLDPELAKMQDDAVRRWRGDRDSALPPVSHAAWRALRDAALYLDVCDLSADEKARRWASFREAVAGYREELHRGASGWEEPLPPRLTVDEARAIIRADEAMNIEGIGPSDEPGSPWAVLLSEARAMVAECKEAT